MAAAHYDLVVWGATGFTGGLVAEYLAGKNPPISWAIAGRSKDKLVKVQARLRSINETCKVGEVYASVDDYESLKAMTASATVVISTVGPFARLGSDLVKACLETHTHYVDSTGEFPWVREMIDRHHEDAVKKNVVLVPCCGYDSLPSDLCTYLMEKQFEENNSKCVVASGVHQAKGGASGGTISTVLNMFDAIPWADVLNEFSLCATEAERSRKPTMFERPRAGVWRTDGFWTVPFIMASVNARIVRRSISLRGSGVKYNEAMSMGRGFGGLIMGLIFVIIFYIGAVLLFIPPTRYLLRKFAPSPGTGPSKKERAKSHFKLTVTGTGNTGQVGTVKMSGGCPGYTETAKFLGECGLVLAQKDAIPGKGGLLTPSEAFGDVIVQRLKANGLKFSTEMK